jgi:hypothetical protein
VQGRRLRHLQFYAGLRNIDGSRDGEFVFASGIPPRHRDFVLTWLAVLASQIVPGSHNSIPTLTLGENQVFTIEPWFQN